MAELEDGCYLIVNSGQSTTKALDVAYALDNATQNVQLHSVNGSSAQIMYVRTASDGKEVYLPLTGMALEADTAKFKNGTNVMQSYRTQLNNPRNKAEEKGQRWDIVDTGLAGEYNGKTYPIYNIKCHYNTDYLVDVSGAIEKDGTNIQIWESTGSVAQMFMFIPQGVIVDGTYALHSALDYEMCADVAYAKTGNGSNVFISEWHDGNNQKWDISQQSDGTVKIKDMNSGSLLSGGYNLNKNETANAYIWEDQNHDDQKYVVRVDGTIQRGDVRVSKCLIMSKEGQTRVLDVYGSNKTAGTNVQFCASNAGLNQYWYLERCEALDDSLCVPDVMALATQNKTRLWYGSYVERNVIDPNITDTRASKWCAWLCSAGNRFQVRYRVRHRQKSMSMSGWSEWKNISTGRTEFEGWGTVGYPNANIKQIENYSATPITIPTQLVKGSDNMAEVQIQAREFTDTYHGTADAHSGWKTETFKVLWQPRFKWDTTAGFSLAKGLYFTFTSDWLFSGKFKATVTGENGRIIAKDYVTNEDYAGSGSIYIPYKKLKNMPKDGEELTLSATFENVDKTWDAGVSTWTCSYTKDHGVDVSPTIEIINDGESALITFNKSQRENVCMMTTVVRGHNKEWVMLPKAGETATTITFRACPQYGKTWDIWCFADTDDATYGIEYVGDIEPLEPYMRSVTFSWEDKDTHPYLMVGVNREAYPTFSYSLSPDSNEYTTSGREHEVVKFGQTVKGSFTVEGVFLDEKSYENSPHFKAQAQYIADQLAYTGKNGQEVIMRNSDGYWSRVAITDISLSRERKGLYSISISAKEVSN